MTTKTDEFESMARDIAGFMGWEEVEKYDGETWFEFQKQRDCGAQCHIRHLMTSLDVIREVEETVKEKKLHGDYAVHLMQNFAGQTIHYTMEAEDFNDNRAIFAVAKADPKTRLRALHRTLDEAGELEDNDGN